jgi:glycerol-3-phosphate cytidylyltransferase
MKTVLTYGTFDLFHVGHLRLLERLKLLGGVLIVGVSTDEFNAKKGKKSVINFTDRAEIVNSIKYVDKVIPEHNWDQKPGDIKRYKVDTFAMGDDWEGKFDDLSSLCDVLYLPRTIGISSTLIRADLNALQGVTAELEDIINSNKISSVE